MMKHFNSNHQFALSIIWIIYIHSMVLASVTLLLAAQNKQYFGFSFQLENDWGRHPSDSGNTRPVWETSGFPELLYFCPEHCEKEKMVACIQFYVSYCNFTDYNPSPAEYAYREICKNMFVLSSQKISLVSWHVTITFLFQNIFVIWLTSHILYFKVISE